MSPAPDRPAAPRTLVVVPAYNEEASLAITLADLGQLPDSYDILIVDDGSADRTGAIADRLAAGPRPGVRVAHLPVNCGIGGAVQTGYLFAARSGAYKYVVQFDADGQHPADAVPLLVAACENEGLDLAIGSRFCGPADEAFRSTRARRVGIRFFAGLIGVLCGVRVADPTSGFRCAGPRAWPRFARKYPTDYPEPESLFWCGRHRLRIGEVPVRMRPRRGGVSSIHPLGAVKYMVKVSLAILIDRLRGREGGGG